MSNSKSRSMFRSPRMLFLVVALFATAFFFTQRVPESVQDRVHQALRPHPCGKPAPHAKSQNGTYCGAHSKAYHQDLFLGIPYAKPPTGNRRFCKAQSLDRTFRSVRPAMKYPKHCIGYGRDHNSYASSEDCLYLNIVRPHKAKDLPVAVWFHGGAFVMGGTADLRYNLSFIVQEAVAVDKPFIGVSVNFRLSGWGFLASEEVLEQGETNLALRDQRLALHWIQENIKAFGGDPNKVTIWGQSAGATSVGFHLTAYGGRDDKLFRAAVMESGGAVFYRSFRPIESYKSQYETVLEKTGCANNANSLQCLRKASFSQLNDIFREQGHAWGPVIDRDFLQRPTSGQISERKFVQVPILTGTNSDEGTMFSPKGLETPEQFEKLVRKRVNGDLVEKILEAYPDDPCFGTPNELGCERLGAPWGAQFRRVAAFEGDSMFVAPRRFMCETWAKQGLSAYCYHFKAHAAGVARELGVPHITEVAFVFSNIDGLGYNPPTWTPPFQGKGPEYTNLAHFMSRSWASFFSDMDPNTFRAEALGENKDVDQWPAYDSSRYQLVLDVPSPENQTGIYVEEDSFREEGMNLINQNHAAHRR